MSRTFMCLVNHGCHSSIILIGCRRQIQCVVMKALPEKVSLLTNSFGIVQTGNYARQVGWMKIQ